MPEFYGVQKETAGPTPTMIRVIRICRKCGARILADAPEGLCPRCVLKTALAMPSKLVAGGDSSAEASARLEHPGIVPIHEVGERDGSCYFSMKFVEGGQLDEVARREPMPPRRGAELIAKVARTVHYAHEHGILHRDIKPGNILLD